MERVLKESVRERKKERNERKRETKRKRDRKKLKGEEPVVSCITYLDGC